MPTAFHPCLHVNVMATRVTRQVLCTSIQIPFPIERRTRIRLASGRNIAMSIYALWLDGRISLPEGAGEIGQRLVLGILKREIIRPLQFDTDGKIVNTASPLAICQARVPGTPGQWDKLDKMT